MSAPQFEDQGKLILSQDTAESPERSVRVFSSAAGFSWEQVARVLRKNRMVGLLVAGAVLAPFLVAALLLRDVYRPTARLDIEPPSSGIKPLHEIENSLPSENQDYLETQVQILKSDALAVSVIRDLGLAGPAKADAPNSENPSNAYLRDQLKLSTLAPSEALALDRFRKALSVDVVRNTRLVEVGYSSHDRDEARRVTNAIVNRYIEDGFKHRYNSTMQVSDWLSSQLNDLRLRLEQSNRAVSDYQKKYGLVELDDRDVPLSQLMSEVNHQLSEAQANRIESEAYVRMVADGQTDSIPAAKDDQVYQNLLIRSAETKAQLAQAKTVYGDANTNVRKLEGESGELTKQIATERERIAERLRTTFSASKEREKLMLQSRERLRRQMGSVSSQLVGYHLLKNEAMANAELYNTLQGRLQEAGIYAGLKSSNIRVVDLAPNLQKPVSPNRPLVLSGAFFLALIAGVLGCFVKESFDNTVRTPDDVKAWIGLRSLAILPTMENNGHFAQKTVQTLLVDPASANKRPNQITLMEPLSAGSEAMRDLRTSLLSSKSGKLPEVVLISSSIEGEGKSTVAVNFALSLAQLGKTCLIDADLRRSTVSAGFGVENKAGLSDILQKGATLSASLLPTTLDANLWILPSGKPAESPADVLASSRIGDLCRELKRDFKFVVIDSPPVIRFSDARTLSRLADEVVLVGRYGITTKRAVQRSAELLLEAQAPVAGFVLNGIDLSSSDFQFFNYGYSKAGLAKAVGHAPQAVSTPDKSRGAHA